MSDSTNARISPVLLIGTGLVIFLANAGLLVLQLVAGRLLAPFIGSSIETWTSVIGVFLTGIAVGNWLGGRMADRFPSSRTVAVVLLCGGLSSLGMVGFSDYALHSGFYRSIPLGLRIPVLALLFCLLPAVVLSLLTPLTIKLLLPDVGSSGRVAGLIFALSTLGCLVGNYFTGFWLMVEFTLNDIVRGVGFGLMALAVPVFLMRRSATNEWAPQPLSEAASGPPDGVWDFKNTIRFAYTLVFLTSFCGMSLELTGTRLLAPFLGVSLFTWTGIIGVMLAGTCCGNYLGGILADRGVGPALRRFAFVLAALAGAAGGPMVARSLFSKFDTDSQTWIVYVVRIVGAGIALLGVFPALWLGKRRYGEILLPALVGGSIGLVLSHPMGRIIDSALPLSWFTDFHQSLSEKLGFACGPVLIRGIGFFCGLVVALLFMLDAPKQNERVSRCGALSGSLFIAGLTTLAILLLLAVFTNHTVMIAEPDIVQKVMAWTFGLFFLPMLFLGTISPQVIRLSVSDVQHAGRVAGNIYAWSTVGAIAGTFVTGYFMIASIGTFRVIMLLAFLLTMLAFFVGQLWKYNAMLYAASIVCGGAIFGLYIVDFGADRYDKETKYYAIKARMPDENEPVKIVRLDLDHLTHSVINLDDPTWLYYRHEYSQGELLLLARSRHEHPNLLIIGGGGYTFPRYAEHFFPEVNNEVVEIDPGVTEIAHEKLRLSRDTHIRTHNMDGRQFISEQAPRAHYHLVMQDAVNDYAVPAHLMTKEYNEAIKATLAPDGAYLLTFIDSLKSGRFWRAAVNTMRESFPYVYLISSDSFITKAVVDGVEVERTEIRDAREVYIIFGSNQPLDQSALEGVVGPFIYKQWEKRENVIAMLSPMATSLARTIAPWMLSRYTHVLKDEELDKLLNDPAYKKIVLTDQYCPVDNLMSDVFRKSVKRE